MKQNDISKQTKPREMEESNEVFKKERRKVQTEKRVRLILNFTFRDTASIIDRQIDRCRSLQCRKGTS